MKTLYVYADFDWLDEPMLVGELGYESLRGSDSYSFKYDNDWLRQYGSLFLSADINNYPGQQYTQPNRDIFGCFSDALPDRWGRLLLNNCDYWDCIHFGYFRHWNLHLLQNYRRSGKRADEATG